MKPLLYLLTLVVISSCKSYHIPERDRTVVQCYKSAKGFLEGSISDEGYTEITKNDDKFISIKNIYKLNTHSLLERSTIWGIKYNDKNYFNLSYSKNFRRPGFGSFDIQGRINALVINESCPKYIMNPQYKFGTLNNIFDDSKKWGMHWLNENGEKCMILIINTNQIEKIYDLSYKGPTSKLLMKSNFNKVLETNYEKSVIKEFNLEQVIDLINSINDAKTPINN